MGLNPKVWNLSPQAAIETIKCLIKNKKHIANLILYKNIF